MLGIQRRVSDALVDSVIGDWLMVIDRSPNPDA